MRILILFYLILLLSSLLLNNTVHAESLSSLSILQDDSRYLVSSQVNYYIFQYNNNCTDIPSDYNSNGNLMQPVISRQSNVMLTSSMINSNNQYWTSSYFYPPWPKFASINYYISFFEEKTQNLTIYTCPSKVLSTETCRIHSFVNQECFMDMTGYKSSFNTTYKFNITIINSKSFYESSNGNFISYYYSSSSSLIITHWSATLFIIYIFISTLFTIL